MLGTAKHDAEAVEERGWTDELPVVLAAVEDTCTDAFTMHGLLATTWFAGPVVIVDGGARSG